MSLEDQLRRMLGNDRWFAISNVIGPDMPAFLKICQGGMALEIVEFAVCHPDAFADKLGEMVPEDRLTEDVLKALHQWVDNEQEAAWLRAQEVD